MPVLREHLKISKAFGLQANPAIHKLLDAGNIVEHRMFHTPEFIHKYIEPRFGHEGLLEAYLHIFADFGLISDFWYRKQKHIKGKKGDVVG
ncbi:MAG: hypothetical protein M1491_05045 [Deltaproteobacteria bacterium]|nr:hypothetical protein [Deltaproteobacteria bacterium]MCL5276726.1 hypothetical protein [Deltaproteobacteria bacterium]